MREHLYNLATDKYNGLLAGAVKFPLLLLSWAYGAGMRLLVFFLRLKAYQARCKVISVGNITLGGTGKTVLVEFIARYLKTQGRKVAILSRGYKRKITGYRMSRQAISGEAGPRLRNTNDIAGPLTDYRMMGDEPYMLSKKLENIPVIVDADRARSSRQAVEGYGADTVILDDGFQQWKIRKDLEIVTIDALNPFGNRRLLPRGLLREPLSALKRADILVLTKANLNPDAGGLKDFVRKLNPKAEIFSSIYEAQGFYELNNPGALSSPASLRDKTVTLLSGIASPGSFEALMKSLGVKVGLSFRFGDHHAYMQEELDKIVRDSQKAGINLVVTTEKDAVRLHDLQLTAYSLQLLVLRITLVLENEQRFRDRLLGLYSL